MVEWWSVWRERETERSTFISLRRQANELIPKPFFYNIEDASSHASYCTILTDVIFLNGYNHIFFINVCF